jgi:hypothetical protein
MKLFKIVFCTLCTITVAISSSAQTPPANAPGPAPAPAAVPAPAPAAPVPAAPTGSVSVLALQTLPPQGGQSVYAVLVSATEAAWVTCNVSAPVANPVVLASGQSWVPKQERVTISLKTLFTPAQPPDDYKVDCVPQFLTQPGTTVTTTYVSQAVPPVAGYTLDPEPSAVTPLNSNDDWTPKFIVSRPGKLTLVFDDKVPGLANSYDTDPGENQSIRMLASPIHTSVLAENTYYRYHFTGTSESGVVLAQQNKTYLLYKNTTPQLTTPVSLTSQSDGVHIKFGLSRKVTLLQLHFPSGVGLPPKGPATGGGASWIYEFVIPTDLQNAAASLGASTTSGIQASLNTATTSNGQPTATGTLILNIIDYDTSAGPTIASLELSVVRVSALPLINALKSQNPRLGLDKTTAQNVSNQALGITASSSQQDKDAATALATVLTQRGGSNFKDSLVTFLISAGKTVAKAYGIPVP